MATINKQITCVILAGGRGQRMQGKDKGLIEINGQPIIEQILAQIEGQCDSIIINANRHLEQYQKYGYRVITDQLSDYQGPLAGIHTAMLATTTDYLITLPCDGIKIMPDYVERMWQIAIDNKSIATQSSVVVAHDGQRHQPVYALMPVTLHGSLQDYLDSGERKIDRWYQQHNMVFADFSDSPECFINLNRPEDLNDLQRAR